MSPFVLLMTATTLANAPADLIIRNAHIVTVDSNFSTASAAAIRDGKFIVVGNDAAVLKTKGPKTRVADLHGQTVLPGFNDTHVHLTRVAAARWRLALFLTAIMTIVYVGFILLIAFDKPLLGTILVPGLSLGILLGVLMILTAWALILIYVRWTNTHYDHRVTAFRQDQKAGR